MLTAKAQVVNDDIEQRLMLEAEQTLTSNTTDCTVQWACVNEALTGKRIKYHNDQWFEFTPKAAGRYFVNIGGQKCRDTRGLQLVVLTGEPCQPSTYEVISCTSLGTQDDVFLTLSGLKAGQRYLLNVDGYLNDFCSFALTVSRVPKGLPVAEPTDAEAVFTPTQLVTVSWTLPDSISTTRSHILRREAHQTQATAVGEQPVVRTVYGGQQADYAITDTLPGPGRYHYQVITAATDGQPPVIVSSRWVTWLGAAAKDNAYETIAQALQSSAAKATPGRISAERRRHQARMQKLINARRKAN
ncbi:hypothetical protein [Hymenobacter roseosalivarius]|uniref:hypothetical protein n=1 Tax=Hymenobacter roseosalivarius TaxID=89967 RepID=UPI00117BCC85|nr:hypothetical protein [Hymenobacter roseosalivarius]